MSLPDTAFIFVLALIIFGPKKLPEIGRQLGRLVGEFRRASNEFKFQIEEELRLADLTDTPKRSASSSTEESSISEPDSTPTSIDSETDSYDSSASDMAYTEDSAPSDMTYTEETLPVGQHPNVEYRDSYELNDLDEGPAEAESAEGIQRGDDSADIPPTIRPATGSQPRTALPYPGTEPGMPTMDEALPSGESERQSSISTSDIPSPENAAPAPEHEPADHNTASTVADVAHG
ncbi:MAG: twin-arginine translocase TatA/TatE family subunit [Acidobacteriaceae bacterium]